MKIDSTGLCKDSLTASAISQLFEQKRTAALDKSQHSSTPELGIRTYESGIGADTTDILLHPVIDAHGNKSLQIEIQVGIYYMAKYFISTTWTTCRLYGREEKTK